MLERTRCLRHLRLSGSIIGDQGADRLAKAIRRNRTLQTLSLGENRLTDAGIKHVADALASSAVEDLWLQRNSIGDQGAYFLACALQKNSKLRQLYLVSTAIGDSGAGQLAKALQMRCGPTVSSGGSTCTGIPLVSLARSSSCRHGHTTARLRNCTSRADC
eukprot:5216391-Amphidinium_carterae.1